MVPSTANVWTQVTKKSTGEDYAMKSIPKAPPNERESKSPQAYLSKLLSEVRNTALNWTRDPKRTQHKTGTHHIYGVYESV